MDNDLLGADQMPSAYEDWKSIKTSPARVDWKAVKEGALFVSVFLGVMFLILIYFYH
jgi:hypothetical protein